MQFTSMGRVPLPFELQQAVLWLAEHWLEGAGELLGDGAAVTATAMARAAMMDWNCILTVGFGRRRS